MTEAKTSIAEIESKLWTMANKLRGSMDAAEYKNYILAFLFYRYLSKKQNEYIVEQEIIDIDDPDLVPGEMMREIFGTDDPSEVKKMIADSRNFTRFYTEKKDANGEPVKDRDGKIIMIAVGKWVPTYLDYLKDVASSLGYFIPPLYNWTVIEQMENGKKLLTSDYQGMIDAFNHSLSYNEKAEAVFKGIFNDVNIGDSRLGSTMPEVGKSLGKIVELISSIDCIGKNGEDVLGSIYEYLIKQFAASAGKKGGEFYTPHEVSELMAKIVTSENSELDRTFSLFDPTCGSGSLMLTVGAQFPNRKGAVNYYGQELNTTTYNIARMNLVMHDVDYEDIHIRNADTLGLDWPDGMSADGIDKPRSFDAVVANPPYSQHWDAPESYMKDKRFKNYGKLAPKSKADMAFLLDGLYHLNNEGTMAIVLPHGVLFRGAAEKTIRQGLLENGNIYAVIGLPANLFYGTSIPTVIVILKKGRTSKDVLFIDASQEFKKDKTKNALLPENIEKIFDTYKNRKDIEKYAHLASIEEIKNNDYNLNIPRYVDTSEEEEEIDLVEVQKEIDDLDVQIARLEKELAEMDTRLIKRR